MSELPAASASRIQLYGEDNLPPDAEAVIYVMSRDQRVHDNHALVYAQKKAVVLQLPLVVLFVLETKGCRARQQYEFMLNGLKEVEKTLRERNIAFILCIGEAAEVIRSVSHHLKPAALYFDFSPLRRPKEILRNAIDSAPCPIALVDTHNVVPAWEASQKRETGARTLRPKLHTLSGAYLAEPVCEPERHPFALNRRVLALGELHERVREFLITRPSNGQSLLRVSGRKAALRTLSDFMRHKLERYPGERNDPNAGALSGLSPYLHFGQISSREAIKILGDHAFTEAGKSFIEELMVRKELSDNYCFYTPHYRQIEAAPSWAQHTLQKHLSDRRPFLYSRKELNQALTHDPAWNAAQRQLAKTGSMHGYMRMYWAKKVLEWSPDAQTAIDHLCYLNDFYSLDGGDPNGYTGIMWAVAGVHDRPWPERPIYGKIRSMVYDGLRRKFNVRDYEAQWNSP